MKGVKPQHFLSWTNLLRLSPPTLISRFGVSRRSVEMLTPSVQLLVSQDCAEAERNQLRQEDGFHNHERMLACR